jgi:hypothetical protein
MSEDARLGTLVAWPDQSVGAAVWLLPVGDAESDRASEAKATFLICFVLKSDLYRAVRLIEG